MDIKALYLTYLDSFLRAQALLPQTLNEYPVAEAFASAVGYSHGMRTGQLPLPPAHFTDTMKEAGFPLPAETSPATKQDYSRLKVRPAGLFTFTFENDGADLTVDLSEKEVRRQIVAKLAELDCTYPTRVLDAIMSVFAEKPDLSLAMTRKTANVKTPEERAFKMPGAVKSGPSTEDRAKLRAKIYALIAGKWSNSCSDGQCAPCTSQTDAIMAAIADS